MKRKGKKEIPPDKVRMEQLLNTIKEVNRDTYQNWYGLIPDDVLNNFKIKTSCC